MFNTATTLRARLTEPDILLVPGAYDALSTKMAAHCGAEAIYMTGFGVSGSALGMPDVGLLSVTEMVDRARAMAATADCIPLIADADNGHGGVLNVRRIVSLYEAAGIACIQLEDQTFPKRCGHMASKEVVTQAEFTAKINAAVESRRDASGMLIIARTDARAVLGFDEALRRGEAYVEAGADLLFIEAPESEQELIKITETFDGIPLVANMVEDGKSPYLSSADLQSLGFSLALFPISSLLVVTETLRKTYTKLLADGHLNKDISRVSFSEYNQLLDLDKLASDAFEA